MKVLRNHKRLLSILVAVLAVIGVIGFSTVPALAATTATITVTASPSFIGITIAQNTWTINGIDGSGKIAPNTTYYSNGTGASGDVTAPNNPVVNGDCYFVVTNASTVATDMTGNMVDFVGGDAMTNINTGYANNGANAYGASTYTTGAAWPAGAVVLQSAASSPIKAAVGATTDLYFGVAIKTQSGAWASGTNMTSTITVTATAS